MNKRFDIKLGLEEAQLEVDKVVEEQVAETELAPAAKVLDEAVEASEKPAEELTQSDMPEGSEPAETPASDAPVEVETETEVKEETTEEKPEEVIETEPQAEVEDTKVEESEEVKEETTTETEEASKEETIEEPQEEEKEAEVNEEVAKEELVEVPESTTLLEIEESVKENDTFNTQVEEATDVVTSLEELAEQLEESLDTGGLNETASEITDIAITSLTQRVGLQPKAMVATEGFKSPSMRIRNTKIAIESIKETLDKIYAALKEAVARSIAWIKSFISRFFPNFESYKAEIKNLHTALSKTTKDTADANAKFDKKSIINSLKAGSSTDIVANTKSLTGFSHMYFNFVEKERIEVVSAVKIIVENVLAETHDAPEQVLLIPEFSGTGIVKHEINGHAPELDTLESYCNVSVLPGDSTFVAYLPNTTINIEKYNETIRKSKFTFVVEQDRVIDVVELPILNKTDITKLLDNLEALCDEGIKAEKTFKAFIKDKEELQKDLDKLIRLKNEDPDKLSKLKEKISEMANKDPNYKKPSRIYYTSAISARVQMMDNTFIAGSAKLAKIMMRTTSSGISYGADCIRAYV